MHGKVLCQFLHPTGILWIPLRIWKLQQGQEPQNMWSISFHLSPITLQISAIQNDFLDGIWDEKFTRRLDVLHMSDRHLCWPCLHPYSIGSHSWGWLRMSFFYSWLMVNLILFFKLTVRLNWQKYDPRLRRLPKLLSLQKPFLRHSEQRIFSPSWSVVTRSHTGKAVVSSPNL